jgi:hypothetical protein
MLYTLFESIFPRTRPNAYDGEHRTRGKYLNHDHPGPFAVHLALPAAWQKRETHVKTIDNRIALISAAANGNRKRRACPVSILRSPIPAFFHSFA